MKKKFGFTLVEMTISMIVIACIAAFITPNITKKLSTKAKANANQLTSDCKQFDFTDSNGQALEGYCKLCYEHKCVSCKLDYRQGYTVIQNTCQYKKCSELFSGCNAKCSEIECLDHLDPANWKYDYQNGDDTSNADSNINNNIANNNSNPTPPEDEGGGSSQPSNNDVISNPQLPEIVQKRFVSSWTILSNYDSAYINTFLTSTEWKKYKYTDPNGQIADAYCINSSLIDSTKYTTQDSWQAIYYQDGSIGVGPKANAPCSY